MIRSRRGFNGCLEEDYFDASGETGHCISANSRSTREDELDLQY